MMETYPFAWIYFIPFVVISAFIILNIVVGIVVNSINEVTVENAIIKHSGKQELIAEELKKIRNHLNILEESLKKD